MTSKTTLVSLAVWLAAGALCYGSAFDGTWQLDAKKSHLGPGMGRNNTVKYEMAFPLRTKVTVEGVDARGKHTRSEWVGMFDGKEYPVTGDPNGDMRSYTKVNDRTLNFWQKKGGKVMMSGKIVISPDGKTRTVTVATPGRHHKMVRATSVYNKVG